MVVVAASVLSKSGQVLLSRQYLDVSRSTVDGYLATFPSLLEREMQHTFVDGDDVRYVFQPMGTLYMVLLTSVTSNIFEDLETMRTFSRVVGHFCNPITEDTVLNNLFTLLYSFDELVSLGYAEKVTLEEVVRTLEMHSENEMLADIVRKERELQAKEHMKRKSKELEMLEKKRRKEERLSGRSKAGIRSFQSFANNFIRNIAGVRDSSATSTNTSNIYNNNIDFMSANSGPPAGGLIENQKEAGLSSHQTSYRGTAYSKSVKSLSLGKKKAESVIQNTPDLESSNLKNESIIPTTAQKIDNIKTSTNSIDDGTKLKASMVEIITAQMNRNGQVDNYEINGALTLNVNDSSCSLAKVKLSTKPHSKFALQVHPNIDKKMFHNSSVISVREGGKIFPLHHDIGVLKWRYQSKATEDLPLTMNTWIDPMADNGLNVIIELELNDKQLTLLNVVISFPLSVQYRGQPHVENISDGQFSYDKNIFKWKIDMIDEKSPSFNIELALNNYFDSADSLYPISCSFSAEQLLFGTTVSNVYDQEDHNLPQPEFKVNALLKTGQYAVV